MSKFSIQVNKQGENFTVQVSGNIDEDVDFTPYSLAGSQSVELQLASVKSINSCGIREWIKWIGTAGGANVKYVECPKIIVDQINMVQGFLPAQGEVVSFYVPFYSEDSGAEKSVLFRNGQEFDSSGEVRVPEIKDESGAEMEMDVVEAKYFKFLKK